MKFFKKERMGKVEKIAEIKKMVESELPVLIKACQENPDNVETKKVFETRRTKLTMLVIETVIGAHTVNKGDSEEWKYVFREKLPNLSELNEICDIIETYNQNYEKPFIRPAEGDDISIPKSDIPNAPFHLEKVNKKEMAKSVKEYISKYQMINRATIMKLAEYGQKLRKKQNMYTAIVIGGVLVTITGLAVTGAVVYNKKKGSNDDINDVPEVDIDDIEVTTEDIPVIEEQDVPVVEID